MSYWLILREQYAIADSYLQTLRQWESSISSKEDLIRTTTKVARFLREMLQYKPAQTLLENANSMAESFYGNTHLVVAKIQYVLAELLWTLGNFQESEPYCLKSLNTRTQLLGPDHLDVAMSLCGLGELLIEKDPQQARDCLTRTMHIRQSHYGPFHPLVARCLQDLAVLADNEGRSEEAITLLQRAIEIREKTLGPGHPHLASSLEALGTTYRLAGQPEKAQPLLKRSIQIYENLHGPYHPSVLYACGWLCHVLKDLKKFEEAAVMEQKMDTIKSQLAAMDITNLGERIAD